MGRCNAIAIGRDTQDSQMQEIIKKGNHVGKKFRML